MITDDQITAKAKEEAQRNITDYAPHSFQAGYMLGAKWGIKEMAKWKDKKFEEKVIFALRCDECHETSCEECPMGRIKKELLPNES